ncbi:hypothetical protein J2X56_004741 [Herbaspirillum sp. 1173]|nr:MULTISPECIES: hypothetical protein [Herbaspirillum]MDR6742708.1 hypothetical protein [Herbaspirillum sp. 1173]
MKTFKPSLASSSAAAVEKLLYAMIYIFSTGLASSAAANEKGRLRAPSS